MLCEGGSGLAEVTCGGHWKFGDLSFAFIAMSEAAAGKGNIRMKLVK